VTTLDKIRLAVETELARHATFINDPRSGLRSVMVIVKVTPTGDPRAVIFSPETERVAPGVRTGLR